MVTERIDIIVSQKGAKEVRRDIEGIGTGAKTSASGVLLLRQALTFLGVASVTREAIKLADAYTTITNRLKLATKSSAELASVEKSLFEISQRTRTEFTTNVQLYNRLAISAKELGANQKTLLTFTEAVGNALAIGGGTVESTRGALIQLSQAIGTTIVRAEEFNSILEGAPRIAQAAAAGLDAAGGSVSKLRQLIVTGKVTSKEFFDAILSQAPLLAEEFSKTNSTIAQSFIRLESAMIQFVGQSGAVGGAGKILAGTINSLADNINLLGGAVVVIAGLLGGKFLINMGLATVAMIAETAAAYRSAVAHNLAAAGMLTVSTVSLRAAVGVTALGRAFLFLTGPLGILATLATVVLTAIVFHTNKADEAQVRYDETLKSFAETAKGQANSDQTIAKASKEKTASVIADHIKELESLNLLIDGYTNSNALIVGFREIAGKVGLGTAPSEVIAQSDKLRETIARMKALKEANGNTDPTTKQKPADEPLKRAKILDEENFKLDQQIKLLGYSAKARETEAKIMEVQERLRRSGFSMSDMEEATLRQKIASYNELNEKIKTQEELYNSINDSQKNYIEGMDAANTLLAQGKISTEQYNKATRELQITMLDTSTSIEAGFNRGLLKVQSQFEDLASVSEKVITDMASNLEDSLVEFAKTGKLSFKSLIDDMISDLIRLQTRAALNSIFGSMSGAAGGGTTTGGSSTGSLVTGLIGAGVSAYAGSSGGSTYGSQGTANRTAVGGSADFVGPLKGYATGTEFTVPGAGGVDSQKVAFRASPGEKVAVTRPGQGRSSPSDTFIFNIASNDPGSFKQSENQIAAQVAKAVAKSRRVR